MQAVILTAGLGTRMLPLTKKIPKGLVGVFNKPLLEYKLDNLPKNITEIVLIIGYKGELIKKHFGEKYRGKKITYIEDKKINGTATALWQAKKILKGRFMVMMGDDIYSKNSIKKASGKNWSIVCKPTINEKYNRVLFDKNGNVKDFVLPEIFLKKTKTTKGLIFTGLYSMTDKIFKYKPVKMKSSKEYSLPKTFLKAIKNEKLFIIKDNFWLSISSALDIKKIEQEYTLLEILKK
jgi:NDP-sugar pyrophosphorylase family protein